MSTGSAVAGTDHRLSRAVQRWAELMLVSLVWLVGSLPVVTAPVMTDWLIDAVRRTGRGEAIGGPGVTLRRLRARFGVATRLGLVHLGVAALIVVAVLGPAPNAVMRTVVLTVTAAVAVTWSLLAPWTWVLLDQRGAWAAVRRAYHRAIGHLSWSVLSALSVLAVVVALVAGPELLRLPVLVIAPGLLALVVITCCERATTVPASRGREHPMERTSS